MQVALKGRELHILKLVAEGGCFVKGESFKQRFLKEKAWWIYGNEHFRTSKGSRAVKEAASSELMCQQCYLPGRGFAAVQFENHLGHLDLSLF